MLDALRPLLMLVPVFALLGLVWLIAWRLGLLKPSGGRGRSKRSRRRLGDTENFAPSWLPPSPDEEPDFTGVSDEPVTFPYAVRDHVLSRGECAFLPVLRTAARMLEEGGPRPPSPRLWVLASVRVAEVLQVTLSQSFDRSRWQSAQNRLTNKQFDFVVCEAGSSRPLVAIELDDRTHAREDRRARDGFLDAACAAAGLPILHVTAAMNYNARAVAEQIRQRLTPTPAARPHR